MNSFVTAVSALYTPGFSNHDSTVTIRPRGYQAVQYVTLNMLPESRQSEIYNDDSLNVSLVIQQKKTVIHNLFVSDKTISHTDYGQVARKSSRPKSCRPKPESCRPKFIVLSPDILSHVARNFIMLKKILKLLVRVKCETMKLRLFVSLSFSWR